METINKPQQDLPNATAILVLGILSLVFCWCYGFPGLILGIIALVLSGKQRRLYLQNRAAYTESSYRNVNSGRTCSIVSICISGCIVFIYLFLLIGIFSLATLGVLSNI